MDEQEAFDHYDEALNAWEAGDEGRFIEEAGEFNAWMMDHGGAPLMPEDWYPEDIQMQDVMWEWIDSLGHEDREEFFGY